MFSPLEQFVIIKIVNFNFLFFDLSITNQTLYLFFYFLIFFFSISVTLVNITIIPNNYLIVLELFLKAVFNLVKVNAGKSNLKHYPYFLTLTIVLFYANLFGMLPYGFTITSHIIITLTLSSSFFFAINFLGIKKHGFKFVSIFLPGGTPFLIMPLIVPIEILSYVSRVISLAVRLFANMMSGHTLLHILTSFFFTILISGGFFFLIDIFPFLILLAIIFMEFGIACLQVYVFIVLASLYIHDLIDVFH